MYNLYNKILKEALDIMDFNSWDDSEQVFKDDIENSLKGKMLIYKIYKIDKSQKIKIFDSNSYTYKEFKDKVYIESEHVQLDEDGFTVNEYESGEYRVYIEDFDKLKKIEDRTFFRCTNLKSIIIPDSVISIGKFAFHSCIGLTSLTMGNSVKTIGENAFFYCTALKKVYVEDIEKFKKIQFEDVYSDPTYYGIKLIELKKDLNEALDLMNFDSWDDSEQSFKNSITTQLNPFKFKRGPHWPEHNKLCIFDQRDYYYDIASENEWPYLREYDEKGVYVNGKLEKLEYGRTIEEYPPNEIFDVIIPELESISVYRGMFACGDIHICQPLPGKGVKDMSNMFEDCAVLVSVKEIDTSDCETLKEMFVDCDALKEVPKFNCKNIRKVSELSAMFYNCQSLKDIPLFDNIEHLRINSHSDLYYLNMFTGSDPSRDPGDGMRVLRNLSVNTLKAWKIDHEGTPWILKLYIDECYKDGTPLQPYFTPVINPK